ncbi:MAG: DUF4012 domain-containing protein [Patescibacteria group bacterium]
MAKDFNLMEAGADHVLHQPEVEIQEVHPRYRQPKKKGLKIAIGIIAVILLVLVTTTLIGAARFVSGIKETDAAITSAQEAAARLDFEAAQISIHDAGVGLERAQSGLVFLRWTFVIPWVGDQVRAVTAVVDAGVRSVSALQEAVNIAAEIYQIVLDAQELLALTELEGEDITFDSLPIDVKADLLRTLHNSLPKLKEMQVKLTLAQEDLDKLENINASPMIVEAIEPFQQILPDLIAGVDFLVPFAASVSELTGVDQDRQWLVLFLNNQEMRPGGGFMGVYGLLLMRDGEIKNLNVNDTYSVDLLVQGDESYQIQPPEPLKLYMGVDKWYFRDANWSPDFPKSATDATQLLRQQIAQSGQPTPEIHGVIGFTPTFASSVLEVTGPITVQEYTFTPENLPTLLEELVEFHFEDIGASYEERKAIVGQLTEIVIDDLMTLPIDQWPALFENVKQGFTQKQIGLYSQDEKTQMAFINAGWAANVDIGDVDDTIMVVDANLAALKTDPAVDRYISYSIRPEGDDYIGTTKIEYVHNGEFSDFITRYRTYTRLYVPLGSELISHSGTLLNDKLNNPSLLEGKVTIEDNQGMTSFGGFISIEPGDSGVLTYEYKLPESVKRAINSRLYQLKVLKQIGAENHSLTLDLDFGKKVGAAAPTEDDSAFGDNKYQLNTFLGQDTVFTVQF